MSMTATLILAMGVFLTLVLAMAAFAAPARSRSQTRRLAGLRGRVALDLGKPLEAVAASRGIALAGDTRMDKAFGRLLPNPAKLATRLDSTGRDWTVGQYGMASAGLSFGMLILLMVFGLPFFGALLLGIALGLWVPHLVVGRMIVKRRNKFVVRFPDAIELLVRGLRSGLPISETMAVVALELPGPIGEEFRAVTDRMRIGRSMDAALQETADRLDIPEFRFFVIAIAIQRETGGNLAETLSNLADVLRKRAQMKLKIKAMSSESKASAYIIGFLPFAVFGMIWMINQPYMARFFIDPRLMLVGAAGFVWMGLGAFIMSRMISFEI
ncbi:type II secretion system F family protein [Sphingomonas sp. Leaf257]|jgi:tight adherence protein B|uniref:type II secretion system F family protein n=1 Tax=Sphingomonas sp. Leaf257 TaxID=1736309 RepID=UPI0007010C32|nr:type II secretion system F family protein [Sphingomonas sp. Leaf257]KQO55672.1 pilus assembly protein TadB [Sphingomonas sp. Leaf257]